MGGKVGTPLRRRCGLIATPDAISVDRSAAGALAARVPHEEVG